MKKLCVIALSLLALPVLADNNRGFYLGAGAASIKDSQDGMDNMSQIRATEFFGGYKYNDALGIELRLGKGQTTGTSSLYFDDKGALQKGSVEREIGNYTSLYYKPELVNDEAKLYALLGYTHVDTSGTVKDATGKEVRSADGSASGYSYGLGVGFVVNEHFNINFEYKNLSDEISGKPNLASVNLDYRF
jgi:outer membrane autotransporter protein